MQRTDYRICKFIVFNSVFKIMYKNETIKLNLLSKSLYLKVYYLILKTGQEGGEREGEIKSKRKKVK